LRPVAIPDAASSRSLASPKRGAAAVAICATFGLLAAGCSGLGSGHGASGAAADGVRLLITPAGGRVDRAPNRGITVRAMRGRISRVSVRSGGDRVSGRLNAARTVWRSTRALNVSQRYKVTAAAVGSSGGRVTRTSSFRTFKPKKTFSARVIEGYGQTYGVGMPIIISFDRPISNRTAVERALQVRTSRRVTGSWYWDDQCRTAPVCLYFRPRHYWRPHTRVSLTAHLDGVEAAPGVYGHHTLAQKFKIGSRLTTLVNTSGHSMDVYRAGKHFAHWPISSGKPGDDTPNGNYLTIEKSNPAEMKGPGYDLSVPWSVRVTWSGDYLHAAPWSVGSQGFANVSHGCVNMSPADAETYYKMAVPGDPVKITGSSRAGTWDNGWTMWFLHWHRWLRGSALGKVVRAGPHGSTFVSPRKRRHRRGATHQAQPHNRSML
jgi:lipoprotein-anchoring transpeptidase ErfK/SrfK